MPKFEANKKENQAKKNTNESGHGEVLLCFHCGKGNHNFKYCKFRKYDCKNCKKKGHITEACKFKKEKNNYVEKVESPVDFFNVEDIIVENSHYVAPICLRIVLNSKPICFEVDTGAGLSCLPYYVYKKKISDVQLADTSTLIKVYNGPVVKPKGQVELKARVGKKEMKCNFLVVDGANKCLLGRDL